MLSNAVHYFAACFVNHDIPLLTQVSFRVIECDHLFLLLFFFCQHLPLCGTWWPLCSILRLLGVAIRSSRVHRARRYDGRNVHISLSFASECARRRLLGVGEAQIARALRSNELLLTRDHPRLLHLSRFIITAPVDLIFILGHVLSFLLDLSSSDKDVFCELVPELFKISDHLHDVLLVFRASLRPDPFALPPVFVLFLKLAPLRQELGVLLGFFVFF